MNTFYAYYIYVETVKDKNRNVKNNCIVKIKNDLLYFLLDLKSL